MEEDERAVLGKAHVRFDGIALVCGGEKGAQAVFGQAVIVQSAVGDGDFGEKFHIFHTEYFTIIGKDLQ